MISPPLLLTLIDSTVNCCASQSVELPIELPCGSSCIVDFFLIPLDRSCVINIEWDYSYYQPWSDNEWLVDEMIAMREEVLMVQNKDITMQ